MSRECFENRYPFFEILPQKHTKFSKFSGVCYANYANPGKFWKRTHSYGFFHEKWDLRLGISYKNLTHFGSTSLHVLICEYPSPPVKSTLSIRCVLNASKIVVKSNLSFIKTFVTTIHLVSKNKLLCNRNNSKCIRFQPIPICYIVTVNWWVVAPGL